jgi:hypothetical protein
MSTHAQPTLPSAAASTHGAATSSLELLEARKIRDALKLLLRKEQAAMAEFLVALADFDRHRGWEALGHASLFAFLHFELGLSNSAAFFRMSAARLLQRYPDLVEPIRDGRLCMSTTAELAKVITEENRTEVVKRFFGRSAREAQEVVAELQPAVAPPRRAVVTAIAPPPVTVETQKALPREPPAAWPGQLACSSSAASDTDSGSFLTSEEEMTRPARGVFPRDDVQPLTADLRRLHITVSRQFLKKLDGARDGLSHAIPGATSEQVLEAALDLLLEKQARARGQVKKPRAIALAPAPIATTSSPENPVAPVHRRTGPREAIPAAVRRAVWARDGGRCSWPLDAGGRCGSTHRLELDHLLPWARGGESTVANLRLVCARHNRVAARQAFGGRHLERYGRRG